MKCRKNAQTGVYGWAWKSSLDGNSDAFLAEGATVDCTKGSHCLLSSTYSAQEREHDGIKIID